MNRRFWPSLLGILVVIAILATGCGAASPQLSGNSTSAGDRGALPSALPFAPPAAAPTAVAEKSLAAGSAAGNGAGSTAVGDRLVIKTGNITIVVKSVEESVGTVTSMAIAAGGFVVSSKSGSENEKLVATLTIKVPAEKFEASMATLRALALEPPTENVSGQDVTEEYADVGAQLRNLQATEKQLLNLLDRAQTVDDTLKVYNQLTNIRGQIERLQGRMQFLERSAALSTITVSLRPQVEKAIVKTGREAWQPGATFTEAARAFMSALQVLGDLGIWALVFSPICLIPLIILWILWRLTRRQKKGVKPL
jgi:hypothetical protein